MPNQRTAVTLKVTDMKDREVLDLSYNFKKTTDIEGQVSGVPRGGQITLTVKARNDGNVELLNWLISVVTARSGSIEFKSHTNGNVMKKIRFLDGYCVDYTEKWAEGDGKGYTHTEKIVLSCRVISVENTRYDFVWD